MFETAKTALMASASAVGSATRKTGDFIKSNSPEITLAMSIISGAAALITAIKSTTKINNLVVSHNKQMERINSSVGTVMTNIRTGMDELYDEKDASKDRLITTTTTVIAAAKHYVPTVIFAGVSFFSGIGCYAILKHRVKAMATLASATAAAFAAYRERVREKLGGIEEKDIFLNRKTTEYVDSETGEVTTISEPAAADLNPYTFLWSEETTDGVWSKTFGLNPLFVNGKLKELNNRLKIDGHIVVNDVLKELGYRANNLPSWGQYVGWVYDPEDSTCQNYISFGFENSSGNGKDAVDAFLDGTEKNVWITLNPDGNILDFAFVDSKFAK